MEFRDINNNRIKPYIEFEQILKDAEKYHMNNFQDTAYGLLALLKLRIEEFEVREIKI